MNFLYRLPNPFIPLTLIYIGILVAFSIAYGCATKPIGLTQTVYSVGWSLVGATNSVADLHDAGTLKGADYDNAKAILSQANAAYKASESLIAQGNTSDASAQLIAVQSFLTQLAAYLASRGIK